MKSGAAVPLRQADRIPIASPAFPADLRVEKSGVTFFLSRGDGKALRYTPPGAPRKIMW